MVFPYSFCARPGWLRLYGGASLSSLHGQTLLARRWESFDFTASTRLEFHPRNFQQLAGLILLYDRDNWCYAALCGGEGAQPPVLRLLHCQAGQCRYESETVTVRQGQCELSVRVVRAQAQWYYRLPERSEQRLGARLDLSHLSDEGATHEGHFAFTGAMVGICCQDMDTRCAPADFQRFDYDETASEGGKKDEVQ